MHEIAGAKPGGEEGARKTPVIRPSTFRFVDRPGRHEDPAEGRYRRGRQAAKRRVLPLQLDQFGFAGQRQFGQGSPVDDVFRMNPGEPLAISRRALFRRGNDLRQRRHQSRFALGRIACFESVVELPLHPKPPFAAGANPVQSAPVRTAASSSAFLPGRPAAHLQTLSRSTSKVSCQGPAATTLDFSSPPPVCGPKAHARPTSPFPHPFPLRQDCPGKV